MLPQDAPGNRSVTTLRSRTMFVAAVGEADNATLRDDVVVGASDNDFLLPVIRRGAL
jgi:hypothetical protein